METGRLLVCVDGSRASLEAARLTVDLAKRWHSLVRALYVVELKELDGSADHDAASRLRESARAILSRIAGIGAKDGVNVEQSVLEGVPFEVILDVARDWKADLIIMGRTGRTGPGRALLGSEAERVLEFSDRPVLIVPTAERAVQG